MRERVIVRVRADQHDGLAGPFFYGHIRLVHGLLRGGEHCECEAEMSTEKSLHGDPPTNDYGYRRYSILGNGMVSRTCSRPQIQATARSMPMPNPPWGTLPNLRRSRYHLKASSGRPCSWMRCSSSSCDAMRCEPPIISPYPSGASTSTHSASSGRCGSGSM